MKRRNEYEELVGIVSKLHWQIPSTLLVNAPRILINKWFWKNQIIWRKATFTQLRVK